MKHHFRQHVINKFGLPVTKNFTVDGELGSGIFDKNGVEIFEGDKVKYIARICQCDGKQFSRKPEERERVVTFENGKFIIWDCDIDHSTLEVVGHAED